MNMNPIKVLLRNSCDFNKKNIIEGIFFPANKSVLVGQYVYSYDTLLINNWRIERKESLIING